jgi:hypothetical protein
VGKEKPLSVNVNMTVDTVRTLSGGRETPNPNDFMGLNEVDEKGGGRLNSCHCPCVVNE